MLVARPQTIDLHAHTRYSDGSLSVMELLHHAREHGVETIAITDHDSLGAHYELASQSEDLPCHVITGLEISTQYLNREIHIVGLNLNIHEPGIVQFVAQQQAYRQQRLLEFANRLEQLGMEGVVGEVEALSAESVTRTHLAQIMVRRGWAKDANRAFKQYIGRKSKAYVKAKWPTIEQAVSAIRGAGGKAVLAHPGRYQLSRKQLALMLEDFAAAGGQAVELAYPNMDPQLARWMTEKALNLALQGSQGADFHNPEWRWVKPGFFADLPKSIVPVWQDFL
ncbi:PHP domain-containing protein [Pleionea litopenaei]|uniref:PHP domain-containing protein n=1 Tax=Pleionea litopenaei TaxID=3070815 RepID=A0AA51RT60_9GAMM|nr:PHP domain-containing protein [Pleionea sp. HL-JVS1]WMS87198.1 PHP domain-containing protein [Pleionea sp. HL-JVS1]